MRIDQLDVQNFRAFESYTLKLHPRFNLVVGDNGTGKTALLRALGCALGAFVAGIGPERHDDLEFMAHDDHRLRVFDKRGVATVEWQSPTIVACEASYDGGQVNWRTVFTRVDEGLSGYEQMGSLATLLPKIRSQVMQGIDSILPLVAFFRTTRLRGSNEPPPRDQTTSPTSRIAGYDHCLDGKAAEADLLLWFKTMELATIQRREGPDRGEPPAVLDAVKAALADVIPGWTDFRYDVGCDALLATDRETHEARPFRLMSDGYRSMTAMVADIARRCAVLNPHLGRDAARETPGVVLIDELDLHLHPTWQRRVVDDLKRCFPKVQFVCTTHSPFIIQQVAPDELRNLDAPGRVVPSSQSIEDITEDVMGVELPQMSERRLQMKKAAEEYLAVLQGSKKASPAERNRLKQRLDALEAPFSDDPAFHAVLALERKAAGIDDEALTRPRKKATKRAHANGNGKPRASKKKKPRR